MKTIYQKTKKFIVAHKIWSVVIIIIVIGGVYEIYNYVHPATTTPQYTVSKARIGKIVQTVTGSGQVSAANQLDLTSQVSGTVQSIKVKVGDQVSAGDLIATIDSTNALNSLNSAKLAYEKTTQPAKAGDMTNAQNSVKQAYDSGFNSVSTTYLDLPNIISGMKDILYGQTGFLSDQRSSYLTSTARTYRDQAGASYDAAVSQYNIVINEYKNTNRTSATTSIDTLIHDTYTLVKSISDSLKNTQNAITFITTTQPDYDTKDASTAAASVNTWSGQINSDLSSIVSSQNNVQSSSNTLNNLIIGTDPLDVQSAQLTLNQAMQTYSNYFIRAPFDGIIGRLPVNVYGQAGSGTTIATIIGNQKIATLSLNEVDASSVKTGNPVSLTFDAINNFTATGTVSEVDLVGTVSSGVVTYTVKVAISNDSTPPNGVMINPGMSVNAVITTNEIDNVLVVPSAAVKTQGRLNYVQTLDTSVVTQYIANQMSAAGITTGSSTRQFGAGGNNGGNGGGMNGGGRNVSLTISSTAAASSTPVTIGATDGTNTQILDGLAADTWVITKTTATAATTAATAPSLLSSLGAGGRGGFGGGNGGTRPAGTTGATSGASAARPAGN